MAGIINPHAVCVFFFCQQAVTEPTSEKNRERKNRHKKNERKIKSDLSRVRTQVVPLSKCNIPGYFTIKLDAPWLILGMLAGETRQCVKNRRNFTQEIREFTRLHKTCSGTSNLGNGFTLRKNVFPLHRSHTKKIRCTFQHQYFLVFLHVSICSEKKTLTGVIKGNQPKQCTTLRETPQNDHTCALFDPPKNG